MKTLQGILLISSLLSSISSLDLQGRLRIIDRAHDFGLMKEAAGPQTGHARFVNDGTDPVSITEVRPSCGCTSADYPKEPVAPGDTAIVSFTYDPFMRPGRFEKTVKVYSDDGGRYVVHISGNVLGTPESLESMYPVDAGAARLSDSVIDAGDVVMGKAPTRFLTLYTTSLDSIRASISSPVKALTVETSHPVTGPGDLSTYTLTFNTLDYPEYGPVEIPLTLSVTPGDPSAPSPQLTYRALVLPDANRLARKHGAKAPACELSPDPIDLGDISASGDSPVTRELTIANTGKGEMQVLRVYCDSPAVTFGKIPAKLKPGKQATVRLRIDSSALPQGPHRLPIRVITDDPLHVQQITHLTYTR